MYSLVRFLNFVFPYNGNIRYIRLQAMVGNCVVISYNCNQVIFGEAAD